MRMYRGGWEIQTCVGGERVIDSYRTFFGKGTKRFERK